MSAPSASALPAPAADRDRRTAFRRYAPTVATIAAVVLCISAGNWQRARMEYKAGLQAQYDAALAAPPLRTLEAAAADPDAFRYRRVQVDGAFDASRQVLVDNKVHEGRPGYEVVAPLRLIDGRVVLVDRGWVALGRSRAELPVVPPPSGAVRLNGRIDLPQRYFALRPDTSSGVLWQHLDLERFSSLSGLQILPVIVDQTDPAGANDELVRSWPAPDFGIDTHRMYMVQWYAFALVAVVFWAVTHWRGRGRRDADFGRAPDQDHRGE